MSETSPNHKHYDRSLEAKGPDVDVPSVLVGRYRDPDPNVVDYINEKFQNPAENIEATLMKALEWSGIAKSIAEIKDLVKPLEKSGLFPQAPDKNGIVQPDKTGETSEFVDRRDERLLLEMQSGNDARNALLTKVIRLTSERMAMTEVEIKKVHAFGRQHTNRTHEVPPPLKILITMLGIRAPEDPAKQINTSSVPEPTHELAPDVYWMMLREELEPATKSLAQDVA